MLLTKEAKHRRPAMTGLETAIILIAFIIVASVFAFTILNLGFQTSEKAGQVVQNGYDQASSSIQLAGDVFATGNTNNNTLATASFTIQLTAGGTPVDLSPTKLVVSYLSNDKEIANAYTNNSKDITITQLTGTKANSTLLESGDSWLVTIHFTGANIADNVGPYQQFTVELKPTIGSVLTVEGTVPGSVSADMDLTAG
jgi:archaeal flagellin FlaB